METGAIVVSAVVGLFGVASAILGFIAEATKLTSVQLDVSRRECVYPANPAFALALGALLLLVAAQIIATAAGGCCGCGRPRTGAYETKRVVGIVASVFSWIAAVIAGASYLQGAAWNEPTTRDTTYGQCYTLADGVFTRAAVLSLIAAVLGINSYIILIPRAPALAAGTEFKKPDDGLYPPAAVGLCTSQWPAQDQEYGQAPPCHPHHAQGFGEAEKPQVAPPCSG